MVNNPLTRGIGGIIVHPQQTLRGAGTAVKAAAVGGGVGYVAWEAVVNDKPMVRTVSDVLIGPDNVDAVVDTTHNVVDGIGSAVSSTANAMNAVTGTASQTGSALNGISDFMRNATGGGGMDMFGNFFSNLGKGNVSGMSIVGLLAAGLMIFGRFGWLGKIGGALLAMMLIGNNSKIQQASAQAQGGGVHR